MEPVSTILLMCHWFLTMELAPDLERDSLELLHLVLFWLASQAPACLVSHRATGGLDPLVVFFALFFTWPFFAIFSRIRKAVRTHQKRGGTLGSFVDEFFVEAVVLYIIPMLYLTMASSAVLFNLRPWAIGSEPGAEFEDDDEAAAEEEEQAGAVFSIVWADWTMNLLILMLAVCQLALFGTGLSEVRALMAFRVPRYQRVAGTGLLIMGLVALFYQAAKEEVGKEEGGVLYTTFSLALLVFIFALGCGLPLKEVLDGGPAATTESPLSKNADGAAEAEISAVEMARTGAAPSLA